MLEGLSKLDFIAHAHTYTELRPKQLPYLFDKATLQICDTLDLRKCSDL